MAYGGHTVRVERPVQTTVPGNAVGWWWLRTFQMGTDSASLILKRACLICDMEFFRPNANCLDNVRVRPNY
jgi:hypothetical protein